MGAWPDAARLAFSFRSCAVWAERAAHPNRSAVVILMFASLLIFFMTLLARSAFFFPRRVFIQHIDELGGGRRNSPPLGDDCAVLQLLPVKVGVVVQILPQGSAFQSDSCEQSLRARPR